MGSTLQSSIKPKSKSLKSLFKWLRMQVYQPSFSIELSQPSRIRNCPLGKTELRLSKRCSHRSIWWIHYSTTLQLCSIQTRTSSGLLSKVCEEDQIYLNLFLQCRNSGGNGPVR